MGATVIGHRWLDKSGLNFSFWACFLWSKAKLQMEIERAPLEDGTPQGPISEGRAEILNNINLAPNLGDKSSEDAFISSLGSSGI